MPESVSIRERIGRVLKVQAETMTDVGDVYRWDARPGQSADAMLDVVVMLGEETLIEEESSQGGDYAIDARKLTAQIAIYIALDEGASETTDRIVNRWLGRMEYAFRSNRTLTETTSPNEQLSETVHWTKSFDPEFQDGMVWAAIELSITYKTYILNPYVGPGISLLTE